MSAPSFEPAYYMDLPAAERAALNDFCCDQTHGSIAVYSGFVTLPAREDATDADEHWEHEGVSASAPGTTAYFVWVETGRRDPDRVYFMPADVGDLLEFLSVRFGARITLSTCARESKARRWTAGPHPPLAVHAATPREALCRFWLVCLGIDHTRSTDEHRLP